MMHIKRSSHPWVVNEEMMKSMMGKETFGEVEYPDSSLKLDRSRCLACDEEFENPYTFGICPECKKVIASFKAILQEEQK